MLIEPGGRSRGRRRIARMQAPCGAAGMATAGKGRRSEHWGRRRRPRLTAALSAYSGGAARLARSQAGSAHLWLVTREIMEAPVTIYTKKQEKQRREDSKHDSYQVHVLPISLFLLSC